MMAAPACPKTTLFTLDGTGNPYENSDGSANGFVCDIGNLRFSDFSTSTPGVPPSAIGVVPITTAGLEGLEFTGPWGVGNNGQPPVQDVNVHFTVTALVGQLTDVHIDLINSSVTGTGNINYTEQVCTQNLNCTLFVDNPNTVNTTSVLYLTTPQTSLSITKDVSLTAGANGSAAMSDFSNYYSHTVPEPRAISILLGIALFGAVVFMKRRQAVQD